MAFPKLISVVLCCHNGAKTLSDQLTALSKQTYADAWELIFVNDWSSDDSVAVALSFASQLPIRIVETNEPLGLARARNFGAAAAAGDVLLFCDDDDVADPEWIASYAAAARTTPAFGGHLEEHLLNPPSVQEWRYPVTPGRLPIAFGRVAVPVGCNCGVWASVFRDVGGFTGEFSKFGSGEEIDFFWRVQLAGYELRYVPTAVMHYRHRQTLKELARQSYRYGLGNAVLFRRFRHLGLQPTSTRTTLNRLAHIFRGMPKALVIPRNRGTWLRMTSYACGQAVGSMRNRVWYID